MSVVLETTDAAALLRDFGDAARTRVPCAVLDPTWPAQMREVCARQVAQAVSSGRVGADDLILFTSGSSSHPRAVVRTRESWTTSFPAFSQLISLSGQDVVWLPGPLSSTLYLFGAVHAHSVGASVVFGTAPTSPGPATSAAPSARHATVAHAVPALLASIVATRRAGELPALRTVVVAGDRVPPTRREQLEAQAVRVVEYYGAAELSIVAVRGPDGVLAPFPGVQTQVRDDVLWCRTPFGARGYLQEGGGALQRDADGWLSVGDLARPRGRHGGFDVLGRASNAVTVGGHTVLVDDVEVVLRSLPGVHDAAVCGLPHPRLGGQLVALVAGTASVQALRDGTAALPGPARPRRFVRVAAIPRLSSGKVSRQGVLRALGEPDAGASDD